MKRTLQDTTLCIFLPISSAHPSTKSCDIKVEKMLQMYKLMILCIGQYLLNYLSNNFGFLAALAGLSSIGEAVPIGSDPEH